MADSFTTRSRFQKQESGQHNNTWGTELNSAGGSDLLDFALDGWVSFALSGTKTLTSVNGATDEARGRLLNVSSGTGGTITIPSVEKWYLVRNNSTGNVIITTGGATNATIVTTDTNLVFCDGTNVYALQLKSYVDAAILDASLSGEIPSQGGNAGKALTTNGTIAAWSQIDPATGISNLAAGIAAFLATPSSANLRTVLTDETGTGSAVFATAPTLANPVVGTQSQADNSTKAASTAYVDTAVSAAVTGLWDYKGEIDCSSNPNYPAASTGDAYVVSVAGKIGGASGASVDIGDAIVAKANNAGGTQAAVGSSWSIFEHNLAGALLTANALSELTGVASTARTNIGAQATLVNQTNLKSVNGTTLLGSGDLLVTSPWTQLGSTINTTSGTTATFSSIAQTYDDLLLVFEGVSHNGAGTLDFRIELSDNGANWTTALALNYSGGPFAGADTVYGSVQIPGYRKAAGRWAADIVTLTADRATAVNNANGTSAPWRIAAGIAHIRVSIASDAFDAGALKLFAR